MNVVRTFVATAAAISVLAAIGCTSTQKPAEVATAPIAVPAAPAPAAEPVVAADAMPSHPALQNERTAEVAPTTDAPVVAANDTPVVAASEPAVSPPAAEFTERAPRADRN